MNTTYYIPIKSVNLPHYFSSGIIAPANYISNRGQDIQNKFDNNIILCLKKFTNETNCALEIILNQEEIPKKISNNFFLFNMPLPISRVKSVCFSDEKQKNSTVFNIESGAAFLPNYLLKVSTESPIDTREIEDITSNIKEINWYDHLKKFDKTLGGFALMKIGKEDFQNYPTHFFKSLGNLNRYFDEILKNQNINVDNTFEFAFTDDGRFKLFHNTIYSDVSNDTVLKYASKDNIKIETRNGLILTDKIPENTQTYLVAILDSYGPGKRKQVDSFISDLVSGKFNDKRKEGLALTFGINKGYSVFRNKYKTENFETSVKFKLDSRLDYYIIESIYQNIFNLKEYSNNYPYIDSWVPKTSEHDVDSSNFETYEVLDKTIIFKKKEISFSELFRTSLEKRNELLDRISKSFSKALPKFLIIDSDELKKHIQSEFDSSLEEYTNFIIDETKKKLILQNASINESQNNEIYKLKKVIENQLNTIKNLEQEPFNNRQSNPLEPNIEKKYTTDNLNNRIRNELQVDSPRKEIEQNFSSSLFSYENNEEKKKFREKSLQKLKVNDLRQIAIDLKITKANSASKNVLITEILNKEF